MKNRLLTYFAFMGLVALFAGCEKDGTKVVMLDNPVPPAIVSLPDLTLERANATAILEFVGTPVNPGFDASANYFLEACATGTNFASVALLYSGIQDTSIKMSVSDINAALLKKFPADATSAVDFRIRAVLVVDAGTGALGTSTSPLEYSSDPEPSDITIYGLPRLDLVGSGITQKIESSLGDGHYTGYVKLNTANTFTLLNPDDNTAYGTDGAALAVDGAAFVPTINGWHRLTADVEELTYSLDITMIGLVGSATPNGWDAPDSKLDYIPATGTWDITLDLVDGEFKFRLNDDWTWNLGGTTDNLVHNGSNIPVTAGNYTISLTITDFAGEKGTYTIVKN